jgi:hypothetical protein
MMSVRLHSFIPTIRFDNNAVAGATNIVRMIATVIQLLVVVVAVVAVQCIVQLSALVVTISRTSPWTTTCATYSANAILTYDRDNRSIVLNKHGTNTKQYNKNNN